MAKWRAKKARAGYAEIEVEGERIGITRRIRGRWYGALEARLGYQASGARRRDVADALHRLWSNGS